MVLKFDWRFNRDLLKMRDKELLAEILPRIIRNVNNAKDVSEINNLKQL